MVTLDDIILPDFWESDRALVMDGNSDLQNWVAGQAALQGHLLFRTSGSTGLMKWIALSRAALQWSAERVVDYLKITPEDNLALALPVHHVGGFGLVARAQVAHCCLSEFAERWSPEGFGDFCEQEKVTLTSLVPTQVRDLVAAGKSAPGSLRAAIVGGGSCSPDLATEARALGWPILASYGMTETASQIATQVSGSEGDLPLIPGWEARIENQRLAVRGEGLLSGIVTSSDSSFELNDPKKEGWFLTSDLAQITENGIRILGRHDRRVKILGELVDLDALEKFWLQKTGGPAAVIAIPDKRRGQNLHLFLEEKAAVEGINQSLPGPERVHSWTYRKPLARTPLGKLDRSVMTRFHLD